MTRMATLRDTQKIRRRESMLDAARELFAGSGYNKTTIDAIADRAEIGVATVYTYFGNKEGLFAELARKDMTELRDEGAEALQTISENPADAVIELLTIYDKVHNYISSTAIDEFSIGSKVDGPLREAARWMDEWKVGQLTTALNQIQKNGGLAQTLPTREAAGIVNELFNQYYQHHHATGSPKKAFNNLTRRVRLLFENWV